MYVLHLCSWKVTVMSLQPHLCSQCEINMLDLGMVKFVTPLLTLCACVSVVCIVTWIRAGRSGFPFWQVQEIYLYSEKSRQALGSTQPPVQWVPGVFSTGVKRPISAVKCSSPSIAKVKNEWCCTTSPPVCLHGVDRNNCSFLCQIVLKYLFLIW